MQTAYALEAVFDEAVFIPRADPVVTVLATAVHPVAIAVAIVACVGGTLAFCAQRATEPPTPHPGVRRRRPTGMPWRTVAPLAVVCAALGRAVRRRGHHGRVRGRAGPPRPLRGAVALWALGSLTAGVITGAVRWRHAVGPGPVGRPAMACAMTPLYFVGSLALVGATLFVAGFAIAPTMIAGHVMTEEVVPWGG